LFAAGIRVTTMREWIRSGAGNAGRCGEGRLVPRNKREKASDR